MSKRLYVGNLPFSATQQEVLDEFSKHGKVEDCKLITDRETGSPRGFGFVTFSTEQEANAAMAALNGQNFGGRSLRISEAEDRPRSGGFRPNGGGGHRPASPPVESRGGGGGGRRGGGGGGGRRREHDRNRYEED